MNRSILKMLVLGLAATCLSCTTSSDGGGGQSGGSTEASSSGGTSSSGSAGQSASGGRSDSAGSSAVGGQSQPGEYSSAAGQSGGGGKSTSKGGNTGSTGAQGGSAGQSSTGVETSSGGTVSTGGQSTNRTTGGGGGRDTGGTGANSSSAKGGAGTGGGAGAGGTAAGGTGGSTSTGTGAAVPSQGCGRTPTLTSGSKTLNGRSYIIRIPSNYDKNNPYRLVFAFHWNGGTMNDIDGGGSSGAVWSYYGLQAQANNTTIFVAPQGNGNGWANSGGADLKFVDDMVALFTGDLCVDTSRIFSMGFSYGGGMSYAIACARAKVFRAVAVYSGAQLSGCDGGKDPIAYLGIHGISDGTCGIAGGRGLRDKFVSNNGCTTQSPPEPAAGSKTHTCTTYTGCKSGYPVEWCAFDGGHTPGMVDGGGDDGAKTWTKGEAWKFFSQF